MRLLKYLIEKWAVSLKDPLAGEVVEVFINPTRKEYKEVLAASKGSMLHPESARVFYGYTTDDIWVWRGDVLHARVKRKIPSPQVLKIVIEPKMKLVHVYQVFKSDEEEKEIMNNAVKKINKFAPETKGYRVVKQ